MPEKFGSSDEDEDDEEGNWIGEYGVDNDFERRRAAANAANSGLGSSGADPEDPFGSRHAMDLGSDDEDNVDEEAWNSSVSFLDVFLMFSFGVRGYSCDTYIDLLSFTFTLVANNIWRLKGTGAGISASVQRPTVGLV